MPRRHIAAVFCAASIWSITLESPTARAAPAGDATVEMARERFKEGVQFFDQKQYEKARLAFLQAYALKPHPTVLLNLAQSELRGARPADAAGHFAEFLRAAPTGAERTEAERGLAAAKAKVGEVTVKTDATGPVTVDGEKRGSAPLPGPLFLSPGSHVIEVAGGSTKTVVAVAGQSTTVDLSGGGTSAAAPASSAAAGGTETGPKPKLSEKPERTEPEEDTAEEPAPAEASSSVEPEPRSNENGFIPWFTRTPLAWVGAGVGVLGVGGATVMAIMATQDYSTADNFEQQIQGRWTEGLPGEQSTLDILQNLADQRMDPTLRSQAGGPCAITLKSSDALVQYGYGAIVDDYSRACSRYKSAVNDADREKMLAVVFGAIGGAALVGTVVYYFLDTSGSSDSAQTGRRRAPLQVVVVPSLDPRSAGASVVGRF